MAAAFHNFKRKQLIRAVTKLSSSIPDLEVKKGSKHFLKLCYPSVVYGRSTYPLSINGNELAHWVIDDLIKWLSKNNICTKKKFLDLLK